MKKNSKNSQSKVVLGRRKPTSSPGKVGGRNQSVKLDWGKVGRRRIDTDDTISEMGASLKVIRQEKGLTVGKLAKVLDVAPATIIKFEDRGYPISIRVVMALAAELGHKLELAKTKSPAKKVTKKKKKK